MTKEIIEGFCFPDDSDFKGDWVVGKWFPGGYNNYLPNALEKFNGKKIRVTIEEI